MRNASSSSLLKSPAAAAAAATANEGGGGRKALFTLKRVDAQIGKEMVISVSKLSFPVLISIPVTVPSYFPSVVNIISIIPPTWCSPPPPYKAAPPALYHSCRGIQDEEWLSPSPGGEEASSSTSREESRVRKRRGGDENNINVVGPSNAR